MTYERFVTVVKNGENLVLRIEQWSSSAAKWVPLYEFPMRNMESGAVKALREQLDSERVKNARLREENERLRAAKAARVVDDLRASKLTALYKRIEEQNRTIRELETHASRKSDRNVHTNQPQRRGLSENRQPRVISDEFDFVKRESALSLRQVAAQLSFLRSLARYS